ncbi:MAG TPA: LysR substrate-binding domain-containing protein [Candidatus Dormibacteraeota bacterium]|nr:LysR substrate-binding domain-containing protein [Candidatus Dormibacteraeota bacterium]
MELRHLRYFLAVAQQRHFTRAAERLGIAQPALSQQIRQLERELGVRLFDRDNRRVSVTAAGQAFLGHAQPIVDAADTALAEMEGFAGSLRGRVVVGTLQSLSELKLPGILARYHERHPQVEIALQEETSDRMPSLLVDGALDIALLDTTRRAMPAGIAVENVYQDDLVVVVSLAHELAGRKRVPLAALADSPFIMNKPGSGLRRTVEQACREAGFTPRVAFESGDGSAVCALAAEGLGVAILPRSVAETAPARVRALTVAPRGLRRTVGIAWRQGRHLSGAASALLALLRESLRS